MSQSHNFVMKMWQHLFKNGEDQIFIQHCVNYVTEMWRWFLKQFARNCDDFVMEMWWDCTFFLVQHLNFPPILVMVSVTVKVKLSLIVYSGLMAAFTQASTLGIDICHWTFRPMTLKWSLLLFWGIRGEMIHD